MSFASTPLGQQRRLDHNTFLGKQPASSTATTNAAPLGSRSPPDDDSALARFARYKQDPSRLPGAPKFATSPPKQPDRWAVKDTTVQLASAIHLAADMSYSNPNDSWASGARKPIVPRSSSVEFENSANAALTRKFPPPNRARGPPSTASAGRAPVPPYKPPSKNASSSLLTIPDSEAGDDDGSRPNGRATSPLSSMLDAAKTGLAQAAFYMRQRSVEPENRSGETDPNNNSNDSYSYNQEDKEYQAKQRQRRIRMSLDNKAYKPPADDSDGSYEDSDDDKKRPRKKLGKAGPPLTGLPSIGPEKRRKKRKGRTGAPDDDDRHNDDDHTEDFSSVHHTSTSNANRSRYSQEPIEDPSLQEMDSQEQVLHSIPELEENDVLMDSPSVQRQASQRPRSRTPAPLPARHTSVPPSSPPFSIGNLLGRIVRVFIQLAVKLFSLIATLFYLLGTVIGTLTDTLFIRPYSWARRAPKAGALLTYLGPVLALFFAWWFVQTVPIGQYLPSFPSLSGRQPLAPYVPHGAPPADISELAEWLKRLEETVSQLSDNHIRDHTQVESGVKGLEQLQDKIVKLELKLAQEMKKVKDAEARARDAVMRSVTDVKSHVEVLQDRVLNQPPPTPVEGKVDVVDEETRAKVKKLEARLEGVEGTASEALDVGKKASSIALSIPTQTVVSPVSSSSVPPGAAWWNKLGSSSSSSSGSKIQIKSTDGQDIVPLLTHLVDSAILARSKDTNGKVDYALSSAGARVIPSLTSPTFSISPSTFSSQLRSLITGKGYYVGHQPITALHHEVHSGHCWPFKGSEGQLGVMLVAPVKIEEVTVDHLAREIALDVRSAPREMEVWGLVEGKENLVKLKVYRDARNARVEAGEAEDDLLEPTPYPSTLPKTAPYIRLAKFAYDVESLDPTQTFAVFPQVKEMELDFGVVVLMVKSNWGKEEVTCLYRFRVHGQAVTEVRVPTAEELMESRGESLSADSDGGAW